MSRLILLLVSLFCLQTAFAEKIYKYVDEHGNTVFTDEPRKGAEVLDVQPVPTVPAFQVPPTAPERPKPGPFKYNKVVIVSPAHQDNFINETAPIMVQVALSPALRQTDRLQLMLNGAPHGEPVSGTQFTLNELPRGQYSATVNIVGQNGEVLGTSDTVEFYVKRHSKLMPKPQKPTPKPKS